MDASAQKQFYERVEKVVKQQAAIRRGEIVGVVFSVEQDLARFFQWGFLTLAQRERLEGLLP